MRRGLAVVLAAVVWVLWLGWREQEAKRRAYGNLAAYARGQRELCDELYWMRWGGPKPAHWRALEE